MPARFHSTLTEAAGPPAKRLANPAALAQQQREDSFLMG
jgi:hypothetical protein